MIWGAGLTVPALAVVDTAGRAHRRARLLGTLQSARPATALMAQHEGNPRRPVSGLHGGGRFFADQIEGDDPSPCARKAAAFVPSNIDRLAHRGADREDLRPDEKLRKALARRLHDRESYRRKAAHVVPPLTQGEGILIADLDMGLIVKRKRMMDSVGHYAPPRTPPPRSGQSPGAAPMETGRRRPPPSPPIGSASDENRTMPTAMSTAQLINELQSYGVRAR